MENPIYTFCSQICLLQNCCRDYKFRVKYNFVNIFCHIYAISYIVFKFYINHIIRINYTDWWVFQNQTIRKTTHWCCRSPWPSSTYIQAAALCTTQRPPWVWPSAHNMIIQFNFQMHFLLYTAFYEYNCFNVYVPILCTNFIIFH